MKCFRQKGFTLVELMVVLAIISILAIALITSFSKIQESARAAKCKTNLRALAQAAQNYGVADGGFPTAGSYEWVPFGEVQNGRPVYRVERGWVAWTQGGREGWPWQGGNTDTVEHVGKMRLSTCRGDEAYISITNGALWHLVGKDTSVFVCGAHKRTAEPLFGNKKIFRSYIMNGYFKYWDGQHKDWGYERRVEDVLMDGRAAVRLLFAELPAHGAKEERRFTDSALKYDDLGNRDEDGYMNGQSHTIGFNHLIAKRWVAHVAFTDGHVEGLVLPTTARDNDGPKYEDKDVKNLTGLLCNGREITSGLRGKMK